MGRSKRGDKTDRLWWLTAVKCEEWQKDQEEESKTTSRILARTEKGKKQTNTQNTTEEEAAI